jgi:hypothetical protein
MLGRLLPELLAVLRQHPAARAGLSWLIPE